MATVRYLVSDVERAIDFYVQMLGFEEESRMGAAFATVRSGDLQLWLSGPQSSAARPMPDGAKPAPGGWNRIVAEVADIDATVARLKDGQARFRNHIISGPGGRQVLIEDPDGNPVEIFQAR